MRQVDDAELHRRPREAHRWLDLVGGTTFVDTDKGTFLPPEERNLGMVFQSYALGRT